ncbi:hypothetical protein [Haloarcula sp. JP-L23]|uniref:DUF7519 family protein n=1 Tax=Haloarcula sp. JP-L23 TaxID=2716717 RepID=UPI00140F471F|nr:hypothetical protein G9465_18065 [Haloarcula sp. JP-L23]
MVGVTGVDHRPTPVASALAVLLAGISTALLAPGPEQRLAVLGTVTGVGLVVFGDRDDLTGEYPRLVGRLVVAIGAVVVVAALAHALSAVGEFGAQAELVPGLVGVVCIGLGTRPLRQRFARRFVSAGLAALVLGVVITGVFERADPPALLAATAAAVVAWDLAEHAISLGEQLRADARTYTVELAHAGVSGGYGAVLVVGAMVLYENGGTGVPLGALALLLAAAVTLMAVLYN